MTGPRRHVVLIGMMGAGKTTVGRSCARRLRRPFVDIDDVVEARAGMSVPEIFEARGEGDFRALERDAIAQACAAVEPAVIACGGGAVLDPENRRLVHDHGIVVWLQATPDELARRVDPPEQRRRPLLAAGEPSAVLRQLGEERGALYASTADCTVDTDGRDVDEVVGAVLEAVARAGGERCDG